MEKLGCSMKSIASLMICSARTDDRCLDDILLMQLKKVLTWGKNATKVGSSLYHVVTILGGSKNQRICQFLQPL
jgi:hypothetical protein